MADQKPSMTFEDIPLEEARRMGWGPRMDPQLYQALRGKIPVLSGNATRMQLPEGTSFLTMKNRVRRVATEVQIPVTVRRVPGGLPFWRSTDEDLQQAREIAQRLQTAQRRRSRARPSRGRRA